MEGEDPLAAAAALIDEADLGDTGALVEAVAVLTAYESPETRAGEVLELVGRILAYDVDEDDDEEWISARDTAEWMAMWARHELARPMVEEAHRLMDEGRGRAAEAPLREAVVVGSGWDEWFQLGWLLVHLPGRREEGIAALKQALSSRSPEVVARAAVNLVQERVLDGDAMGARRYAALALEQDVDALNKFGGRMLTALGAELASPDRVPSRIIIAGCRFRRWRVRRRLTRAER